MGSYVHRALDALSLFKKGRDYIISGEGDDRQVTLVDEQTGRLKPNTRLTHTIHEAS